LQATALSPGDAKEIAVPQAFLVAPHCMGLR
jgi:hypothetical protein